MEKCSASTCVDARLAVEIRFLINSRSIPLPIFIIFFKPGDYDSVFLNIMFGQRVSGGMGFEWINMDAHYKVQADILWILVSEN